ncbi:citryl-CoA lyase [Microbacterium sp. A93]|uniref:citryl-CoA lyase n=1 Tax=Microbacterium sp. A93 TaxID=3450716 RepID=UPI003F445102
MSNMTWSTAIAQVREDEVIIRGHRLDDLVGRLTYTEASYLILSGRLPEPNETKMLDAIMVSLSDHGISPSTIVARMLASTGTPVQASIAGGVLTIADYHGGPGEQLAQLLIGLIEAPELSVACAELVASCRAQHRQIPGFGHPQHPEGDPRALRLLSLAAELGVAGQHCAALEALGTRLGESTGRSSLGQPNVTGALAGILLDFGFPWQTIRGIVIASRSVGLAAHVAEEMVQGNRWRHASAEDVTYTGPLPEDE